jgi:hypothetical protein
LRLQIVGWDRKNSKPSGCTKGVGRKGGRSSSEQGSRELNREFGAEDRLDLLILVVLVNKFDNIDNTTNDI